MYISAFHIDAFGIFSNVSVTDLPPGITIFLGQNEAGKSTCLEFLRCMLMGYPKGKNQRNRYKPLGSGPEGGSLTLRLSEKGRDYSEIRLSRQPASVSLAIASSNQPLPEAVLAELLSGVSRDVYTKVFGFSLGELENFESLSSDGVRNALYAASFGGGIQSPAKVMDELKREMDKSYKPRAAKLPINEDLAQLEELSARIQILRENNSSYDGLRHQRDEISAQLEDLDREKSALEKEIRRLERKLGAEAQWDQWSALKNALDKLEAAKGSFPENAGERLARIQEARFGMESAVARRVQKIGNLRERLSELRVDSRLLDALPVLRVLNERKSSYRQALARLENLQSAYARAGADLQSCLAQLGSDWDCGKIRDTDRSLFIREDMERQAEAMRAARLDHQAVLSALERINQEEERAGQAYREAREELKRNPEPDAILNQSDRDGLRGDMGRLEDCRRQAPLRRQALMKAKSALCRALRPLQINFGASENAEEDSGETGRIAKILDNLLDHQGHALKLAQETVNRKNEADQVQEKAQAAEREAASLQKELFESQKASMTLTSSSRETLDKRWQALRSLRSLSSNMTRERERIKELDERIESGKSAGPRRNWALLIFALILMGCAAAIFAAHWFWHLAEFRIGEYMVIPLNLWAAYLPLACGVLLLAFALPGQSVERKRRKDEMAQMEHNRETAAMRLAEMGDQATQLSRAAGIDSMENDILDALEQTLEQEKIQIIHDQHFQEEIRDLKKREDQARHRAEEQRDAAQNKNNDLQQARRQWHELMQSFEIGFVPLPEEAQTFFARVEGARAACDNVENCQRELDAVISDLNNLENVIQSIPAIAAYLNDPENPLNLETAVKKTLDSCREADAIHEQRIHLLATARNLEAHMKRNQREQEEALSRAENSQLKLEKANNDWSRCLARLNLGQNLAPETAREAFKLMQQALDAEAAQAEAARELKQARGELQSLEEPLAELLVTLGRDNLVAEDRSRVDWLSLLDSLEREAETAYQTDLNADRVRGNLKEQEDELAGEQAALSAETEKENALYAQAGVDNADDFLRLARTQEERRKLQSELAILESALKASANGEDLGQFLQSFEGEDIEEQEQRLAEARARLQKVNAENLEKAGKYGELKVKEDALANTDELARLRQQKEIVLQRLREQAANWCVNSMAQALLKEGKTVFERERQPEVIKRASEIFRKITNNRWYGLGASLDDSSLTIIPPEGAPLSPEVLSRGAQEQAYLSLRLAYIRNHAEHAETLPVIMDEILVNFDPGRAERAAAVFADLAVSDGGDPQQIFYFTCQPHMVDMIKKVSPQSPVYTVENRAIVRN